MPPSTSPPSVKQKGSNLPSAPPHTHPPTKHLARQVKGVDIEQAIAVEEDARRAEGFASDRAGNFVHVRRRALGVSDAADVDVAVVWGRSAGDVEESRRQEDVFGSIRAYRLVDERG